MSHIIEARKLELVPYKEILFVLFVCHTIVWSHIYFCIVAKFEGVLPPHVTASGCPVLLFYLIVYILERVLELLHWLSVGPGKFRFSRLMFIMGFYGLLVLMLALGEGPFFFFFFFAVVPFVVL